MSRAYEVKQGDTMILIAHENHFRSWETIWNHENNRALREKRPNPQTLYPGDEVFIPDPVEKKVTAPSDQRHVFRLRPPAVLLFRIWLRDEADDPFADRRFELDVDGQRVAGRTAADGLVSTGVPPTATHAHLRLWLDDADPEDVVDWDMQIGHLDPANTISGAQGRLRNLGYDPGPISGNLTEETVEAIKALQLHLGYDVPTGELDEKVIQALAASHDGEGLSPS